MPRHLHSIQYSPSFAEKLSEKWPEGVSGLHFGGAERQLGACPAPLSCLWGPGLGLISIYQTVSPRTWVNEPDEDPGPACTLEARPSAASPSSAARGRTRPSPLAIDGSGRGAVATEGRPA